MIKISQVLKLQLFLLFLLTVINFFAFYYHDVLPDHYFSISSTSNDINFFSYYIVSLLGFIGYYMGPWIFIPFVLFALFFTFQFSKREVFIDSLNFLTLVLGSLFTIFYFSKELVGSGIGILITRYLSDSSSLIIGTLLMTLFFAGSFRNTFKEASVKFFVTLGRSPGKIFHIIMNFKPRELVNNFRNRLERVMQKSNLGLSSLLKGDNFKRTQSISLPVNEKYSEDKKGFEFTKRIQEAISQDDENKIKNANDYFMNNEEEIVDRDKLQEDSLSSNLRASNKEERVKSAKFGRLKAVSEGEDQKQYFDIVTTLGKGRPASNKRSVSSDDAYFADIIEKIEMKMVEFKIDARIINVMKGPVVDTFELDLGPGVKVAKILQTDKDISLALAGAPVRIVYPLIGKTTLGIEVPRNPRDFIYLDEVLESKEFKNNRFRLPIAMGKNAFGQDFIVDLAAMPHMLVAGATGAGKSVFINSLLVSLLVKKSPSQMKLILIDPKKLELAPYRKLPHLVMPVVTDAKTAAISLLWAVQEMERRYSILQDFAVRNIEGFNEKLKEATPQMLAKIHHYYENEVDDHYELPYLVIIVDEFADLILNKAGKEIEENICRLAQKARASGIHLVLATQRPSVDVVTGLIKANFPTRLAFKVSASQDSRTILNTVGAEKLLGKGDMLYSNGTTSIRGHSSFVDEKEVEALTEKLEVMGQQFHEDAISFLENGGPEEADPYAFGSHISNSVAGSGSSEDELYKDAVRTVVEHKTASASMLQRRLKIGYNRAANLVEQMELNGVVGPAEGSKRRKVLVSSGEL